MKLITRVLISLLTMRIVCGLVALIDSSRGILKKKRWFVERTKEVMIKIIFVNSAFTTDVYIRISYLVSIKLHN